MRSAKSVRLTGFLLAVILCFTMLVATPAETASVAAKTELYNEPTVRVGLYAKTPTLDTRQFSSLNSSESGFDIGYSANDSFIKLFSLGNTQIIILPQVNAVFNSDKKICVAGNGNIGAYSVRIGSYGSFVEAESAAKAAGGFVAVTNNGFETRCFPANSYEEAKALSGSDNIATPAEGGLTVIDASTGKILFTYENGAHKLALRAQNNGAVSIPVKHRSGNTNTFSYLGFFEYSVSVDELWMVNCIGLEDYTKCVMANEIGTNFTVETRKAFSVLARTVPLYGKHNNIGFDVCGSSACCQVYHGTYRMNAENNGIVDATRGSVCTYDGEPILVLYHTSNGGATCSSAAAWGGTEIPYLTTVFLEEPEEKTDIWSKEYTKEEFYKYLREKRVFSSVSDHNISLKILETDPYGSDYVTKISVSDGSGNIIEVETCEDIRTALGLGSANFKVEYSDTVTVLTADGAVETKSVNGVLTADGYKEFEGFDETYVTVSGETATPEKITISGKGSGHGVGFSAVGSEVLVSQGYDYKYILGFFFKGTKLKILQQST